MLVLRLFFILVCLDHYFWYHRYLGIFHERDQHEIKTQYFVNGFVVFLLSAPYFDFCSVPSNIRTEDSSDRKGRFPCLQATKLTEGFLLLSRGNKGEWDSDELGATP